MHTAGIVYRLHDQQTALRREARQMLPPLFLPISAPKRDREVDAMHPEVQASDQFETPPKYSEHNKQRNEWRWAARRLEPVQNADPEVAAMQAKAYSELLEMIQQQMLAPERLGARVNALKCLLKAPLWDPEAVKSLYTEIVSKKQNFEAHGHGQLIGKEFNRRLDLNALRAIVLAYAQIWHDDANSRDLDQQVDPQIQEMLGLHASAFLPMVDAMRESRYAKSNHKDFHIKYRFQQVRHKHSSNWHMDNQTFQTYADDGQMERAWNESATRALVSAACVRTGALTELTTAPSTWHNCGTIVATGVPVLTPAALNTILEKTYELGTGENKCAEITMRQRLTREMMAATSDAMDQFETKHGSLETAGVRALALENGVIGDYNDFMFHRANSHIPDGYARVFFVIMPTPKDVMGRKVPFRSDANISHTNSLTGEQESLRFMFEGI